MYTENMNGLGKSKFKKILKKLARINPLVPLPVQAKAFKKPAKRKIAPVVNEPVTMLPTDSGAQDYDYRQYPMQQPEYQPQTAPQTQNMQPQYFPAQEQSARVMPEDYFPNELTYRDESSPEEVENFPLITPYESAVASQFPSEEDLYDNSAQYESEAGFLKGLGQESGSTGGWFTDLVSVGAKEYAKIQQAKIAAKQNQMPAPYSPGVNYRYGGYSGGGLDMSTMLIYGVAGLGAFMLYKTLSKKR